MTDATSAADPLSATSSGTPGCTPNPGKAADGKRLPRLEVDDTTAPIVKRIFAEYIAGKGYFAIAAGLTADGVPSPSAHDPARNRHRDMRSWSKIAVRSILMNPRYTGRQVWKSSVATRSWSTSRTWRRATNPGCGGRSPPTGCRRPNPIREAIISSEEFAKAQSQMAAGPTARRRARPHDEAGLRPEWSSALRPLWPPDDRTARPRRPSLPLPVHRQPCPGPGPRTPKVRLRPRVNDRPQARRVDRHPLRPCQHRDGLRRAGWGPRGRPSPTTPESTQRTGRSPTVTGGSQSTGRRSTVTVTPSSSPGG